jgi:hypothetical protein
VLCLQGLSSGQFTIQHQMLLTDLVRQFCGVPGASPVQVLIANFTDGTASGASGRRLLDDSDGPGSPHSSLPGEHSRGAYDELWPRGHV